MEKVKRSCCLLSVEILRSLWIYIGSGDFSSWNMWRSFFATLFTATCFGPVQNGTIKQRSEIRNKIIDILQRAKLMLHPPRPFAHILQCTWQISRSFDLIIYYFCNWLEYWHPIQVLNGYVYEKFCVLY